MPANTAKALKKRFGFILRFRPEAIEILVEDRGQAFDPVAVQARIVREADSLFTKKGPGFALIKEMMDEVRFEKTEIGTRLYHG